jgi:hypothetical protein
MEPPCVTCIPQIIHPWINDALTVFGICADQWMIAPNGYKLGLKNSEIESAMRIFEIEDQPIVFMQVKSIANIVATMQNNKNFPEG